MKVFLIISVARQVDGEYCVVKAEKAFKQIAKAEEFASKLSKKYAESIPTSSGSIACVCERGIFEIEVEDD